MSYETLADLILFVHLCYVGFVLFGQLLILVGWLCRWRWVRNLWFRLAHLLAIVLVVIRAVFMDWCPLTNWEAHFRKLDHETTKATTELGKLMQTAIGYDLHWSANTYFIIYTVFALFVIVTLIAAPPRWRKGSLA